MDDDEVLPTALLLREVPETHWNTQSGGISIAPPGDSWVEELWSGGSSRQTPPAGPKAHGWQDDPEKRKQAEDHGQRLLEEHFRRHGCSVQDTRYGNPFDAVATKGRETRYLEAKGTQGDGDSVLVTAGEVNFARLHAGECVIGIVSDIRFDEDGRVDATSGTLRVLDWDPDRADLLRLSSAGVLLTELASRPPWTAAAAGPPPFRGPDTRSRRPAGGSGPPPRHRRAMHGSRDDRNAYPMLVDPTPHQASAPALAGCRNGTRPTCRRPS